MKGAAVEDKDGWQYSVKEGDDSWSPNRRGTHRFRKSTVVRRMVKRGDQKVMEPCITCGAPLHFGSYLRHKYTLELSCHYRWSDILAECACSLLMQSVPCHAEH